MKFNDIIESFNRALDELRDFYNIDAKTHFSCYTVHSTSTIGNIRDVYSCVNYISTLEQPIKVVETSCKEVATEEQLQQLINKTECKAVKDFLIFWTNNFNKILNDKLNI